MNIKKIVVASGNAGKIKEIKEILKGFDIVSMKELGFNEEIQETGSSLKENALIKAKTIALKYNLPALADDSGLFVNALDGAPGIYAGRFSGGDDISNYQLLLKKMEGKANRHATCECEICLYLPTGKEFYGNGKMHCEILTQPIGNCGFGYDPVLYSCDLHKPYAQTSSEEKNQISHRKQALEDLLKQIENF